MNKEQLNALREVPEDQEVVMLNLLKYKENPLGYFNFLFCGNGNFAKKDTINFVFL